MRAEELRAFLGERVDLELAPASGEMAARGRVVGTVEAADGVVLVLEPDGAPGSRRSYHSHHIIAARRVMNPR